MSNFPRLVKKRSSFGKPATRQVVRANWHSALRPANRRYTRTVIPYRGPTLRSALAMFNAYYRIALKLRQRWDPEWQAGRPRPITEENHRRFMDEAARIRARAAKVR